MPDEYISREAALEITTRTCGDYAAAFAEIRKLPAADVAEVVHGKWIKNEWLSTDFSPVYDCSECHKSIEQKYLTLPKRCGHCGALMDGGCENA